MIRLRNKRAVSPVIATVILVAIAITVAVAVAFWIGGITGQYTRFEKIEILSAYCETSSNTNGTCWQVTLDVRNTGTTEAAMTGVYVNGKAIQDYGDGYQIVAYNGNTSTPVYFSTGGTGGKIVISPGDSKKLIVQMLQTSTAYTFTSGTTVEVSLHSGAGNTYMKMLTLT